MRSSIITALDIGSSNIRAIIAKTATDGRLEIKGLSEIASEGIERGIIVDIQAASACVKRALEEAENMAECKAQNIYSNITGEHIRTYNAIGRISIPHSSNEPSEIGHEHIDQVITDAKGGIQIQKGSERLKILHALPQYYDIDNQKDILNPINMCGFHLTSHVFTVLAEVNAIRNLAKCIEVAGYEIDTNNVILNHIAAGYSTLTIDEKKLGTILIDIGGGTCDIALYNRGSVIQVFVIPMAGNNISRDLSIGLKTNLTNAEYIKNQFGSVIPNTEDVEAYVDVEGISGRASVKQKVGLISQIIQHRIDDIMTLCYQQTVSSYTPELITAGIVVTGGTSHLKNIDQFISNKFNLSVKIGYPDLSKFSGIISRLEDPSFAVAIGMLYYAIDHDQDYKGNSAIAFVRNNNIIEKIKKICSEILS